MKNETLKVKVLVGYGFLLAFLGALYMPELVKAFLPFAICLVFAAIAVHSPAFLRLAREMLKSRARHVMGQASWNASSTGARWVEHIDYDNYFIPTYLRKEAE